MRAIYILIGLLFDLIILAAAGFAIYCAANPGFFKEAFDLASPYFDDTMYRIYVGGGGGVLGLMALRGFFLLIFGRAERDFVIKRAENGSLTVSRSTLELVVDRLARTQDPPAKVSGIRIAQDQSSLRMRMKVRLDFSKCNLGEFVGRLDSAVRTYFKDSLGITLSRLDIQAEADDGQGTGS